MPLTEHWTRALATQDHAQIAALLAAAEEAARDEQREADARIAEVQAGGHYMARICAAAIRNQDSLRPSASDNSPGGT